ncbi:hyaluronan mediated motility receptor isoform X2 [Lepisosteus oculatus]|uniref:hyaluronan mediated motility receptor isoform X2 n=1 Tax=Lepisosteus oculatus TaxID=7918 RepID=UPI0035F4FF67
MEEEQNPLTNLSKLLLQLAFQTQGLAQRKDETQKMIQIYSREIAEEKLHIQEIKKKIEKLEEELIHRQKLVKQYKHNSKSFKASNSVLLRYMKSLQAELERRQAGIEQDIVSMKQSSAEAQGQMESYGEENRHVEASLFSQQKKLQNMMTDEKKDEIREKDEAKETEEDVTDEKSKEKSMPPGSPLALVDTNNNSMRQYSEIKGQFISGCEELQVETKTQEDQLQLSGNKWNETNEREQTEEELIHFCTNQSEKEDETIYPQTPPARMKASSSTPTFTLQSPICSGDPESKSPGFLFSLNSNAQEAATFPEFNCDVFGTRSSHEEGNPFSFTSSYFSEKETKTALPYDNKEPGFLFDPMERGEEEEKFEFSFSSKSPVGCGDAFPFLFNSGKFQ